MEKPGVVLVVNTICPILAKNLCLMLSMIQIFTKSDGIIKLAPKTNWSNEENFKPPMCVSELRKRLLITADHNPKPRAAKPLRVQYLIL